MSKYQWRHLPRGQECRLCGAVVGNRKSDGKRSTGCSFSVISPGLYYCHRQRQIFYVDRQGQVRVKAKWEEVFCCLCGGSCLLLKENPRQRWCRAKGVTFFVRGDGTVVCRALEIGKNV